MEVILLNPSDRNSSFWNRITKLSHGAADDLGINLEVIYSDSHHFLQLKSIEKIIAQEKHPDFIMFMPFKESIEKTFSALEKAKIPFVTLERVYGVSALEFIGLPQEKYKYWLGEMYHDNVKASYDLSLKLVEASKKNSKHLNTIANTGDSFSINFKRIEGLERVLMKNGLPEITQSVRANWKRKEAQLKFELLQKRYGDINFVWAASDDMALGAADAAIQLNMKINKDIVVGGFDWTPEAIRAIDNGELTASVGGHFMQGAWALIKLYDHYNGLDIFQKGDNTDYVKMQVLDKTNVARYRQLMKSLDLSKIDFAKFSLSHKANNSPEEGYRFTLEQFMNEYNSDN